MAIIYDNKGQNFATGNVSFSYSVGASATLLVVMFLCDDEQPTFTNVQYGGQSLSQAVRKADSNAEQSVDIWYKVNPLTGANNVTATNSNGSADVRTIVSSYIGATGLDNTASSEGTSGNGTVNITPTRANCLIVGGLSHEDGGAATPSGETSLYDNDESTWNTSGSYYIQSGGPSQVAVDWTGNDDFWSVAAASFYGLEPKTHTVDGIIVSRLTSTPTADGVISAAESISTDYWDAEFGAPPVVKTYTADGIVLAFSIHTLTADAEMIDHREYRREARVSLPTDDTVLTTLFSAQDYADVASSDDDRVDFLSDREKYAIKTFRNRFSNNTSELSIDWEGQVTIAPSDSTVYLQIYNFNSDSWETLDSDNSSPEDEDFTLTGGKTTSLTDYYENKGGLYWTLCRVYQLIP